MPKYLTPTQYRRSGDGMVTAVKMFDDTLANFILRAESDIDSFMGFDPIYGGFEPHEVWYQEVWDHITLKVRYPNTPVPNRRVLRYRIQVSNISTAGAGFFADINPGDAVMNITNQYIEIVPLQAITYSMTPVILQLGLNPPIVQVDYEAGYYLPQFGDALYDSGDGLTFRAIRGFWATSYHVVSFLQPNTLPPIPPVVYVNGIVQNTSSYTVNATEGSVTFNSTQKGNSVTADYTYQIPDFVKAATTAQTSWLIGQADLNANGMAGLDMVRNDREEARRMRPGRGLREPRENICMAAQNALDPFIQVAVG